jgi:hypothetical protein
MNTITSDYQQVLERVQEWPTTSRLTLIQDIIETINREQVSILRGEHDTLSTALGLLVSSDKKPPTDDEVARWLDEHRMEKYG